MIRYENCCFSCAVPGYPCRGEACENRHVPVAYCDGCGRELESFKRLEGEHWCEECGEDKDNDEQ